MHPEEGHQFLPQRYKMGHHTYGVEGKGGIMFIRDQSYPERNGTFEIGNYCSVAPNIKIYLGVYHRMDWISMYPFPETCWAQGHPTNGGNVKIGNDVWICDGVTIMGGVTIGDGAVIACNSHVVKDVEPFSLHGGNPNRFIKWRFPEEIREKLLKLKWWDFPHDEVKKIEHLLCSSNFGRLFDMYSQRL
ncbi:CatB-related O-acetyltransferase [Candidatus Bathyarchaeota archaeon]|nr:CatB-related O-acetyltransferase [Candidatus Bathyarchaeota archaeon]